MEQPRDLPVELSCSNTSRWLYIKEDFVKVLLPLVYRLPIMLERSPTFGVTHCSVQY